MLQQHAALLQPSAPVESRFRSRRPPALHPRAAPIDDFPLDTWRRLVGNALLEDRRDRLSYGPSAGLPELRAAIVRHLALQRGLVCAPEQVLIINSPLQGIKLIARTLLEPGDAVWLEDPSHPSLALDSRLVTLAGRAVPLTEGEFEVLWLLASHAGKTLSRHDILKRVRGLDDHPTDRSIDSRVYRIRAKLGDRDRAAPRIRTVRHHGYLFSTADW